MTRYTVFGKVYALNTCTLEYVHESGHVLRYHVCCCFQCHDTSVQFVTFLGQSLTSDELRRRVPGIADLMGTYYIPPDVAFALTRFILNSQISAKWEELKKADRKDKEKQTTAAKVPVTSSPYTISRPPLLLIDHTFYTSLNTSTLKCSFVVFRLSATSRRAVR